MALKSQSPPFSSSWRLGISGSFLSSAFVEVLFFAYMLCHAAADKIRLLTDKIMCVWIDESPTVMDGGKISGGGDGDHIATWYPLLPTW